MMSALAAAGSSSWFFLSASRTEIRMIAIQAMASMSTEIPCLAGLLRTAANKPGPLETGPSTFGKVLSKSRQSQMRQWWTRGRHYPAL
jgi:hypothetical protein